MMWRRRNSGDVGRRLEPDQQNGAGSMINDKPGGLAQALRTEPGPVAVPRHDQKIRTGSPSLVNSAHFLLASWCRKHHPTRPHDLVPKGVISGAHGHTIMEGAASDQPALARAGLPRA